jgi:hypothetical protein
MLKHVTHQLAILLYSLMFLTEIHEDVHTTSNSTLRDELNRFIQQQVETYKSSYAYPNQARIPRPQVWIGCCIEYCC